MIPFIITALLLISLVVSVLLVFKKKEVRDLKQSIDLIHTMSSTASDTELNGVTSNIDIATLSTKLQTILVRLNPSLLVDIPNPDIYCLRIAIGLDPRLIVIVNKNYQYYIDLLGMAISIKPDLIEMLNDTPISREHAFTALDKDPFIIDTLLKSTVRYNNYNKERCTWLTLALKALAVDVGAMDRILEDNKEDILILLRRYPRAVQYVDIITFDMFLQVSESDYTLIPVMLKRMYNMGLS